MVVPWEQKGHAESLHKAEPAEALSRSYQQESLYIAEQRKLRIAGELRAECDTSCSDESCWIASQRRTDGHSLIGARGKQPLFKGVLKARPKVCNAVQCRGIQPNKKQGMKTPVC